MAFTKTHKHYRAASKKPDCACNDEFSFYLEKKHLCGFAIALAVIVFLKGLLIGLSLNKN